MKIYTYLDHTSNRHWFKIFRNALKCVEVDIANKYGLKEVEYTVDFDYLKGIHMYSVCLHNHNFEPCGYIEVIETED